MSDAPHSHPPVQVAVVPHTHWDREWYLPFPAFQLRLVELLDDFLPRLESDSGYDHFLLDGQMAVVDDYLEVRPEAEARLRRLAASGKLTVGPWYILMDEFLVSGETIVRNLQLGLRRARDLGGAMAVGYLPDMFGHIAQMPQLLRLAGLEHAVVWRGVPFAVDRTAFWWQAPDGSAVRAEYLLGGYGNGASVPADPDALLRRSASFLAQRSPFTASPGAALLWMNGTDHQTPQPWLGAVLAGANARQDGVRFAVASLPDYLAAAPVEGLATWTGELRSGARANLLMGVASNRVDVKQVAARAERALERRAEPLCALWLDPNHWPAAELALAWRQMIRNSAHDSICACSHDRVATAVLQRYDDALSIAEVLLQRAREAAAACLPATGPVVLNPSARPRNGVVEVEVEGDEPIPGTQLVEQVTGQFHELCGRGADFDHLLSAMEEAGFPLNPACRPQLDSDGAGITLGYLTGGERRPDPAVESLVAEASALAQAYPERSLRVHATRPARQRLLAFVETVPGFGWTALTVGKGAPPSDLRRSVTSHEVAVAPGESGVALVNGRVEVAVAPGGSGVALVNGRVEVAVENTSGEWSLRDLATGRLLGGLGRVVDGGDAGDSYNYSPPAGDALIDRPSSVNVEVLEGGPVRAVVRVVRRYHWPVRLDGQHRCGSQPVDVLTDLELRAGEEFVRVALSFDNRCRDHRVRVHFALPDPVERSRAECAFAVVDRGLDAESGPHEYPLATFPSRRFVRAGPLTVLHEGLLEYELVDGGGALALTVLRATGMLSRPVMAYRDNAAGPSLPLEGPQLRGPARVRFALHAGETNPFELADQVWVPLEVVTATAPPPGPGAGGALRAGVQPLEAPRPGLGERGCLLEVAGAEVSALQRVDGALELRVFNPHHDAASVCLPGRRGRFVDLRGELGEPFQESFTLRPWGIATLRLDP